jgi:flagellar assembly protein FliH
VSADPQSICGIVYAALQRLQNREVSRIRVYPAALQAVRSALERNGGMAAIELIPDALLQSGGIVFETALGELDASVETQLQEIERGFADRLQG